MNNTHADRERDQQWERAHPHAPLATGPLMTTIRMEELERLRGSHAALLEACKLLLAELPETIIYHASCLNESEKQAVEKARAAIALAEPPPHKNA